MDCTTCNYRYTCFTLAEKERPLKVRMNTEIAGACYKCKFGMFKKPTYGATNNVGLCDHHAALIHKKTTCIHYIPVSDRTERQVTSELTYEASKKRYKIRMPKYCLIE
jgi:hypothetical protein